MGECNGDAEKRAIENFQGLMLGESYIQNQADAVAMSYAADIKRETGENQWGAYVGLIGAAVREFRSRLGMKADDVIRGLLEVGIEVCVEELVKSGEYTSMPGNSLIARRLLSNDGGVVIIDETGEQVLTANKDGLVYHQDVDAAGLTDVLELVLTAVNELVGSNED